MNFKFSKSKLFSLLFTLILMAGFQDALIAQVQVTNFTGCTVTVYVGQNDASTPVLCDLCPVNPPTAITIASGATVDIYGQDVCYEEAGFIGWAITGSPGFGLSPNPGLPVCVPTLPGPACGAPTTVFWVTSGPGYVSAFIF